ncbi:MAG: hypothetical protein KDA71_23470 [Planctomycetales bacterium]|nr:hypothetical protein [Planctomycetales bacterium]
MSNRLRAGDYFPAQVEHERGLPDARSFMVKVLSSNDSFDVAAKRYEFLSLGKSLDPEERLANVSKRRALFGEMLSICVKDSESLTSELTDVEGWDLINAATEGASLSDEERKKFVSLSGCETSSFVSTAATSASTE